MGLFYFKTATQVKPGLGASFLYGFVLSLSVKKKQHLEAYFGLVFSGAFSKKIWYTKNQIKNIYIDIFCVSLHHK